MEIREKIFPKEIDIPYSKAINVFEYVWEEGYNESLLKVYDVYEQLVENFQPVMEYMNEQL